MEYMDIRVRMPLNKLGTFVQMLPDWAQMVGYDKLKSDRSPKPMGRPPKSNGEYVPQKGTTVEALLNHMKEKGGPCIRKDIFTALQKKKHTERALSSGFQQLRNRGLIQQQTDGSYVVKN